MPSAAKQFAEKAGNCSAKGWHSRRGMEKIPASQAVGNCSGFLTSFGMTSKCIFPQTLELKVEMPPSQQNSSGEEGWRYTTNPSANRYQLWPRTNDQGSGFTHGTNFVIENQEPGAFVPNW